MPTPPNAHPGSLLGRVLGIIHSPRATCEAVARAPRGLGVLAFTFLVSTGCTALLLETNVGQLALLDQWERTASAFGQTIDDTQYAAMENASRSGAAYAVVSAFVSGPLLTVGLSGLFFAVFRAAAPGPVTGSVTYRQVLAVAAHAGVILALRHVVAAPVTYARETLASPMTLGLFFGTLDEASLAARFFGIIDLFVLWWIVVLSIGVSVLYRRPVRQPAIVLMGTYLTLAVLLAVVMAVIGGTA